ncbi:MAG: ABC transporter ATP-binding protein [Fibrobacter sp.]|nr:ABC transporter ATP-binding protein [Fibrobacter sp.]
MILEVKKLLVGYHKKPVAAELNFSVAPGDFLCIVGTNGAGKSTLLKTLLGLIRPISGNIIYQVPSKEIGYLPQQNRIPKNFPASVLEIVLSGRNAHRSWRPFYSAEDKRMAFENMERLNVLQYANKCLRELSGGEQQRVLLARALCAGDKLLFLDEPVASLDPEATADFYGLLKTLNESGLTIVMVTHDEQEGLENASQVLHVGNPNFYGDLEEYRARFT